MFIRVLDCVISVCVLGWVGFSGVSWREVLEFMVVIGWVLLL